MAGSEAGKRYRNGAFLSKYDANGDDSFDFGDTEAFFLVATTDPVAYLAQYPDVAILRLDMNDDGNTDFGDIEAFFTALTEG